MNHYQIVGHCPKFCNRINRPAAFQSATLCLAWAMLVGLSVCVGACKTTDRYSFDRIKTEFAPPKTVAETLALQRPCPPPASAKAPPDGEPLTLNAAIRLALQNNPDMDAVIARIRQSDAMLDEAESAFWPVLSVYGEYLQGNAPSAYLFKRIDQRRLPPGTDFNQPGWFENYEIGIQGRINLFNGGRDYLRKRMAETGLEMSRLERATLRNGLTTSVIHAYYSVLAAEKFVDIAQASVDTVRTELELMRIRYKGGGVLKSDVLSLEVSLARAQEELIRARNNLCLTTASLANLLGLDPDTRLSTTEDPEPPFQAPDTYEAALVKALAQRPELRTARLQVVQSRMGLDAARSQFLPRLDAQAKLYADDPGFDFAWDRRNWTAGVILNWDLFTGFRRTSQTARARAVLEEMLAADRKATLDIQLEVKTAFLKHEEAKARWQVGKAAVAQSEASLRLVEKQYEGGSATITRYLQAELAWNRSRLRATQARYDREKTAAAIGRAMGVWVQYGESHPAGKHGDKGRRVHRD